MDSESKRTSGITTAATSADALRPRFRERQVLRAADLEAEQSYLIAARRRHNIGQHGWGIVQGLEIADTPALVVQPGLAVDGYGRELIVQSPIEIPAQAFTELADNALDVWLVYKLVEVNVPQHGSWDCGPERNSRTREQPSLLLTAAAQVVQRLPTEVPRNPTEVPSADLPFLPHRRPPDDPASEWPVYLGTIKQTPQAGYDPNSPRPYATLTGEIVTAPSGRARMQVGSELQNDRRRFSVDAADSSGNMVQRLAIDRDGNTFIIGNTTITGSERDQTAHTLRMRTGAKGMINPRPLTSAPAAAAPWQIYRTSVKQDKRTVQQLRVEIGHPGEKGDPKLSQLAVGTRNAAREFVACFTLSADGTLTIEGNVTVGKQLVEGPIQLDVSDPRYSALLAQQWVEGTKVGEKAATTGTIQGTVRDGKGALIPGAAVELKNLDTPLTINPPISKEGRFIAAQILIGRYSIKAEAPGFVPKTIENPLAAGETIDITFTLDTLPLTGNIRGVVLDLAGAFIPGISVELTRIDVTTAPRQVTTDDGGNFIFSNIPNGRYRVTVTLPGFIPEIRDLTEGQTLNIILSPTPPP